MKGCINYDCPKATPEAKLPNAGEAAKETVQKELGAESRRRGAHHRRGRRPRKMNE
jgi:hypothetical protein